MNPTNIQSLKIVFIRRFFIGKITKKPNTQSDWFPDLCRKRLTYVNAMKSQHDAAHRHDQDKVTLTAKSQQMNQQEQT